MSTREQLQGLRFMYSIQHAGTVVLIHETMVGEELEQHMPHGHRERRGPDSAGASVTAIRAFIAKVLFALGAWIAPTSSPMSQDTPLGNR